MWKTVFLFCLSASLAHAKPSPFQGKEETQAASDLKSQKQNSRDRNTNASTPSQDSEKGAEARASSKKNGGKKSSRKDEESPDAFGERPVSKPSKKKSRPGKERETKPETKSVHKSTKPSSAKKTSAPSRKKISKPTPSPKTPSYSTVVIGLRPLTASSDRRVRNQDFVSLPTRTPSDLLLLVPQLHISQHSGSGKGHQIFLRGFDCEHGDNLSIFFEGVPLNEPSHVHGVGYTDLHFLIPSVLKEMRVIKGPYDARYGDFSTAGAVNFTLKDRLEKSVVAFGGGSFQTMEGMLAFSPQIKGVNVLVALEGFSTQGFTAQGKWDGFRAIGKVSKRLSVGKISLITAAYGSHWKSTDAIPQRLLSSGEKGFYDGVDPTDGGSSSRQHLSLHYKTGSSRRGFKALAYLYRRTTRIYTNYTYLLENPSFSDQSEQGDARWVMGAKAQFYRRWKFGFLKIRGVMGGGWKHDDIETALYRTEKQTRFDRVAELDQKLHNLSAFTSLSFIPCTWVRLITGLRYDYFLFDVQGLMDLSLPSGFIEQDQPVNGTKGFGLPTPKVSLVFLPHRTISLFLNYGMGFHSPDARDPILNDDMDIPVAHAGEVGFRLRLGKKVDIAGAFWGVYMERDMYFDPKFGRSVDTGSTRRLGGELEARGSIKPWLYLFLDASYTDAKLIETKEPLIGSPSWLCSGGAVGTFRIPWGPQVIKNSVIRGGLRLRYIGSRYLAEGMKAEDAFLGDILLDWDTRHFGLSLSITNFWDAKWRDAQFYYTSRASLDEPIQGIKDFHFTPGSPLEVKATLRLYLP